jgi:hypothetical protein
LILRLHCSEASKRIVGPIRSRRSQPPFRTKYCSGLRSLTRAKRVKKQTAIRERGQRNRHGRERRQRTRQ